MRRHICHNILGLRLPPCPHETYGEGAPCSSINMRTAHMGEQRERSEDFSPAPQDGQQVQKLTASYAAQNKARMTKVLEALRGTLGPQ